MLVQKEINLGDFEFWNGAKTHYFTGEELSTLQHHLEELYPNGLLETELNDLFCHEEDYLCKLLEIDYENNYCNRW